jgi:hypothetical protein
VELVVVCGDDDRGAFFGAAPQQVEDGRGAGRVEMGRWLVGEQHVGAAAHCAGECDPVLLAERHLQRVAVSKLLEAELAEQFARTAVRLSLCTSARSHSGRAMFSATVSSFARPSACGSTAQVCHGGAPSIGWPSSKTLPASGESNPHSNASSALFPDPERPETVTSPRPPPAARGPATRRRQNSSHLFHDGQQQTTR